ncbi:MAG: DNA internalization-related competence protein ComEC/Rec2 [Gammaproteobacteria bacterium CG11_big_fil_rev_8_21_14_0_20_46_22]|nr:MAG: DNA internalization-related competence protein ComEC/Rec2 [Gammaproteobacteria bacterium CG12_big_fil_rev_8_21_14_0_65_46_12]PIR10379.1 MAG: DNA internalization-related competence protein ComEC/Rec2 [Gammaproteobacteria bacterium CG11_big_fil_rev_8_21_14_0_20_46_22]
MVVCFWLGVASLWLWACLPAFFYGFVLCVPAALALFQNPAWLKAFGVFALGVAWVLIVAHPAMPARIPPADLGKPVLLSGCVSGLVSDYSDHASFTFQAQAVAGKPLAATLHLSSWGRRYHFKPGQCFKLMVKLKPIHGSLNPGGFDYEQWAFEQGFSATGYVKRVLAYEGFGSRDELTRWRQALRDRVYQVLAHTQAAALMVGITLGDKSGLSAATKQAFQLTGTSHMLAISGLHVGFVALLCFWLVRYALCFVPMLLRYCSRQKLSAIASLLFSFLYVAFSGFSVSAVRAYIMLMLVMLFVLLDKKLEPWRAFRLALWFVLIVMPLSVLSPSFYLSFGAVFIILLYVANRLLPVKGWRAVLSLQCVIVLAMLPLSVWYFQHVSLISPLVNLLAIPYMGFVLLPLSLLTIIAINFSLPFAKLIAVCASFCANVLLKTLMTVSQWPGPVWHMGLHNEWGFVCLLLCVFVFLLPRGFVFKPLAILLLLPAFFSMPSLAPSQAKFAFLDVGQGLAVVVRTAHHALLFDTGPRYSAEDDAGVRIIAPYLLKEGIHHLDTIVLSHWDSDHSGGLNSLAPLFHPETVYAYRDSSRFGAVISCRRQHWVWDGVHFQLFAPKQSLRESNNQACLLKITVGRHSVLLVGDVEKKAEQALVSQYGEALKADLTLAPHHGSKTSSSWRWLRAVLPRWVVMPVGFWNRFHFPSPQVVLRYHALGAKILRLDHLGCVSVFLGPAGLGHWRFYRTDQARIWRRQ